MRTLISAFAACALFGLANAQTPAADPPASETTPKTQAPVPAEKPADSTVVTTVKVAPPTANAPNSTVPPETLKAARSAGYQPKTSKDGVTRFCKSEPQLGSHFAKETCLNQDQLQAAIIATQQQRDRLNSTLGSGTSTH